MSYSSHERGFCAGQPPLAEAVAALRAMRGRRRPRGLARRRIWDELHTRLYDTNGGELQEGPILQKGVVPLRAFVAAPMRHGRLFLAGDAAHIVPPTGAKGLNLAVADVRVLSRALIEFFRTGATERLDRYSDICLKRVWKVRALFQLHDLAAAPLRRRTRRSSAACSRPSWSIVAGSLAARTTIGENYVGLPFEED